MKLKQVSKNNTPCLICGKLESDKHHVKTRGSGGGEDTWNKILLCRKHHIEIHSTGIISFARKYYVFKEFLENNGWVITRTKIFHPKE